MLRPITASSTRSGPKTFTRATAFSPVTTEPSGATARFTGLQHPTNSSGFAWPNRPNAATGVPSSFQVVTWCRPVSVA